MTKHTFILIILTLTVSVCFSQQYGTFKDPRDGRVYKTVKIGDQEWMAENLNTDRFRNGDPIPQAKTTEEWEKANNNNKPAWCYYLNDTANGQKYGKLYNWFAVNDPRGLAPNSWHIASIKDWETLEITVENGDGRKVVADKLKENFGWLGGKGIINGSNSSGFSALPGGYRDYKDEGSGWFNGIGRYAGWWTSTPHEFKGYARYVGLGGWFDECLSTENYRRFECAQSVRCLKNGVGK